MGHTRLHRLARTRKWVEVVRLIENGATASQVANAAIRAAEELFSKAAKDTGLVESFWLLTQLPLAARSEDFSGAMRDAGMDVGSDPGLFDIIGAFSEAVDQRMANNGGRTDLGEMAQMAASETLARVINPRLPGLFGTTPEDVKNAFAGLATQKQFSITGREFYARLTNRCLQYFVNRVIGEHTGEGRRFSTVAQQRNFSKALETHTVEAAKIVDSFSGEWFSKILWEKKEISKKSASGFVHIAMGKMVSELKEGARPDA